NTRISITSSRNKAPSATTGSSCLFAVVVSCCPCSCCHCFCRHCFLLSLLFVVTVFFAVILSGATEGREVQGPLSSPPLSRFIILSRTRSSVARSESKDPAPSRDAHHTGNHVA